MPLVSWQDSWPPWLCIAIEAVVFGSETGIASAGWRMRGLIPSPGHPCFVRATPALSRRSQANDQPASASPPPSARISSSLVGLTSHRLTLHPLSRPLQSQRRGVAQLGSAGALGALGRRFESCRPDHSHSKGSRLFRGPSFLACFGVMCARCAQKKRRALRCRVFCAQRCAKPGGVPTWLDLSLRMVWVASPASTWPAPADAICHHQPGLRLSERHGHPNHPDVGMRPPRPRLSRSE